MYKYLMTFTLIALAALVSPSAAKTPDGVTPAVESVCDVLPRALWGLCVSYCEAMDCDFWEPHASPQACQHVAANYQKQAVKRGYPPLPPCVEEVNQPPELAPIGNQTVNEGELLEFTITASDPDGDNLGFAVANPPTGADFTDNGDGTAVFSWTPDFIQAGNFPVTVIVTDDGVPMESDSEEITITVGDVNLPPELAPIGNRTVDEGELLEIILTASDPDGDTLSFAVANPPTGADFTDNGDGTAVFTWTPDFTQAGNFPVTFTVTDNGTPPESDSEEITITVGDVNRPPELDPIGNRTVNEGELLEIILTASDPDGDTLSFAVDNPPDGSSFVDNGDGTAVFSWTPDFTQAGNFPVTFTVTDNGTPPESDSEEITITVGDVNRPPELDPIGNRTVNEGELLEIILTASDPDGDTLSFAVDNPPDGSSFVDNGDGTAAFSWTPDSTQTGDFLVTFTVTDDSTPLESDSEEITITVASLPEPPAEQPPAEEPPAEEPPAEEPPAEEPPAEEPPGEQVPPS